MSLFLILAGAGFFCWWEFYETPPEKWDLAEYSRPEDYAVIETPEGQKVINEKAGISFMVPEGWILNEIFDYSNQLFLYSPDSIEKNIYIMEKGCRVVPATIFIKTNFNDLETNLKKSMWGKYNPSTEILNISGKPTFKYIVESAESEFYRIGISIPLRTLFPFGGRLHSFGLDSAIEDRENCIQEFENFLQTIVIE